MSITASTSEWNEKSNYHELREGAAFHQVEETIFPNFQQYCNKNDLVICDFACGHGSIALEFAKKITSKNIRIKKYILIDVVQENLNIAVERLSKIIESNKIEIFLCNGSNFIGYHSVKADYLYCWDAMVHFDILDVCGYMKTLSAILNGIGFFHHSNYDTITKKISDNPHYRNFNSKNIFHQIVLSSGHRVLSQNVHGWPGFQDLDCLTTVSCSE